MKEGFLLNPSEIAEGVAEDIAKPGVHLRVWCDGFAHPDFRTGMTWEVDPVDRAVVVFVGTRDQVDAVAQTARRFFSK